LFRVAKETLSLGSLYGYGLLRAPSLFCAPRAVVIFVVVQAGRMTGAIPARITFP
jgi:hypothetical protein